MANNNILTPIGNALYDYGKWFISCWTENDIDFRKLFKNMKFKNEEDVYPKLVRIEKEEYYTAYEFTVPIGMSIKDFEKKDNEFAQILNVDKKEISFERKDYNLILKCKNKKIPSFIYNEEIHKAKGFKIPVGIELNTLNLRYWDLSDPANSHCYIAGGTRCGKSTLLRLIMCFLVRKRKCDVTLDLLNEKRVDLIEFKNCKNVVGYTEDPEEGNNILLDVIEEMERRYIVFSKKGVKNIWDYRKQISKMPIRIIVIEELSSYVTDKEFHRSLMKIASRGAGAGVFLLLTTQLPNKDVLPNLTKQNINTVFGGKCKDTIRSDIIVEDGGLNKLRGKGHMKVFDAYDYGTEIQVLYVDDETVEEIASRNRKGATTAATVITPDNKNAVSK